MSNFAARDVKRIQELCAQLDVLDSGSAPIIDGILTDLADLLVAPAVNAYSIEIDGAGLSLDWIRTRGIAPRPLNHLQSLLNSTQFRDCAYSPITPDPRQRNRPLTFEDLRHLTGRPGVPAPFAEFLAEAGYPGCDQLRILVCDGPALLAWVGGYRPDPFTVREKRILRSLGPALKRRLRWERYLDDAALGKVALEAALEAIPSPTFVVSRSARVVHCNRAGSSMLAADRARAANMLTDSLSRRKDAEGLVTQLATRGGGAHYLVLFREGRRDVAARAAVAAERWQLTPRQAQVLELMAQGFANKSMGAILGCAVGTVELHVSAILRKADVESRAELVATFWSRS
jgi:DNA-binding CsgD family transcriptional regulator